jgi:hypothetical protein
VFAFVEALVAASGRALFFMFLLALMDSIGQPVRSDNEPLGQVREAGPSQCSVRTSLRISLTSFAPSTGLRM